MNKKKKVGIVCQFCNKLFLVQPSRYRCRKSCSRGCAAKAMSARGTPKPSCIKCKKEIGYGKSLCGSCCKKGKIGNRSGKHSTYCGDKHHNWKGGISHRNNNLRHTLEYRLWRTSVFERDDYTCVFCGLKSGNGKAVTLHADHIKPFSLYEELRFDLNNGRTLCIDCHKKTPTFANKWMSKESI